MEIKYIVKEEEGKVIAMFEKEGIDMRGTCREVEQHCSKIAFDIFYAMPDRNGSSSSYQFNDLKGVATCHPGDEFDVKKGKSIAAKKLMRKYHHRMKRGYQLAIQDCKKAIAEFERLEKYHVDKEENLVEDLRKNNVHTSEH